jgi:hypothetical protein
MSMIVALVPVIAQKADAASLSSVSMYYNRNQASLAASDAVNFILYLTPANETSSGDAVTIDFDGTGFCTDGSLTSAAPSPTKETATTLTASSTTCSSEAITITTSMGMNAGTKYGILISNNAGAITTPTAGEYEATVSTPSDSSTIALRFISDDQIEVTGDVVPSINFQLNGNTLGFGTFTTNTVRYATSDGSGSASQPSVAGSTVQATVSTNAANGIAIYSRDAYAGLYSPVGAGKTIAAAASATCTTGTECYSVYPANASGLAEDLVSAISATDQLFAHSDGYTNAATVLLIGKGNTLADTPTTSYSDTVTMTATGKF